MQGMQSFPDKILKYLNKILSDSSGIVKHTMKNMQLITLIFKCINISKYQHKFLKYNTCVVELKTKFHLNYDFSSL